MSRQEFLSSWGEGSTSDPWFKIAELKRYCGENGRAPRAADDVRCVNTAVKDGISRHKEKFVEASQSKRWGFQINYYCSGRVWEAAWQNFCSLKPSSMFGGFPSILISSKLSRTLTHMSIKAVSISWKKFTAAKIWHTPDVTSFVATPYHPF